MACTFAESGVLVAGAEAGRLRKLCDPVGTPQGLRSARVWPGPLPGKVRVESVLGSCGLGTGGAEYALGSGAWLVWGSCALPCLQLRRVMGRRREPKFDGHAAWAGREGGLRVFGTEGPDHFLLCHL